MGLLLALGAGRDLWRAAHPRLAPAPLASAVVAPTAPGRAESRGTPGGGEPPVAPAADRSRLDLNRATLEQLEGLPGIGPVLAARIADHRRRHGPFHSVEELRAVRGIGPRLIERLRPHVAVDP